LIHGGTDGEVDLSLMRSSYLGFMSVEKRSGAKGGRARVTKCEAGQKEWR